MCPRPTIEAYYRAKEAYYRAKETYYIYVLAVLSAKEAYYRAKEAYYRAKEAYCMYVLALRSSYLSPLPSQSKRGLL